MRPYRGLTKEGKWVYGDLLHIAKRTFITQSPPEAKCILDFTYAEVIPETVGQQVGLKDKNGKDLDWWEGDIFARSSDGQIIGSIVFDLGCFWLDRIDTNERVILSECVDWSMCKVGNIHQPELMEQNA